MIIKKHMQSIYQFNQSNNVKVYEKWFDEIYLQVWSDEGERRDCGLCVHCGGGSRLKGEGNKGAIKALVGSLTDFKGFKVNFKRTKLNRVVQFLSLSIVEGDFIPLCNFNLT